MVEDQLVFSCGDIKGGSLWDFVDNKSINAHTHVNDFHLYIFYSCVVKVEF